MNRPHHVLIVALSLMLLPGGARAQTREHAFERLAERLAASAERIASRMERHAAQLADRVERELAQGDRGGRRDRYHRRDRGEHEARDRRANWIQVARLDTTIAFSADGTIDLTSISGDITVTGWDRREARILVESERRELEYDLSSSRISIAERRTRGTRSGRGDEGARFELSVPRGVRVIARSTSGDIVLRGTGGAVELHATSGDIEVEDAARRIEIGAISGDVVGKRLRGSIDASSVSGSVELDDVEGDVHMGSTSGDLSLTKATSREVQASTTSGEVVFDGSFAAEGRYEFNSHSGNIELTIPAASNVRFTVGTYSGELDSDFPITLRPDDRSSRRPRRFDFTVGSGGPRVIAETFSGNLDLRRR